MGWISVHDKMPQHSETVIITICQDLSYGKNTDISIVVCEGTYDEDGGYIPSGNKIGGFDTYNDWDEGQPITVTHWQPFPVAPKEELN